MATEWTEDEINVLKSLFMRRFRVKEIARLLKRSLRAVDCKVNKLGLPGQRKKGLARDVRLGTEDGLSDYQLSTLLGVCRNTVGKYRKSLGRTAP